MMDGERWPVRAGPKTGRWWMDDLIWGAVAAEMIRRLYGMIWLWVKTREGSLVDH